MTLTYQVKSSPRGGCDTAKNHPERMVDGGTFEKGRRREIGIVYAVGWASVSVREGVPHARQGCAIQAL